MAQLNKQAADLVSTAFVAVSPERHKRRAGNDGVGDVS